ILTQEPRQHRARPSLPTRRSSDLSKSFCRKTSLGQWTRPPHHYCLYVTAITEKNAPDDPDEKEAMPAFTLQSDFSSEPYSLFVRLPKRYSKNEDRKSVV